MLRAGLFPTKSPSKFLFDGLATAKFLVRFKSDSKEKSCKLLIIGGGAGGCTIAAKFAPKLGKSVIIVEPSDVSFTEISSVQMRLTSARSGSVSTIP